MSDFRYLDYEGLATYTEHVKDYADGKIVYISDESEIPDPPKEGTLYVIGSEILMDEEIIIGTQTAQTSSWTGKSIDTRLHDGKRIAYYLPFTSYAGSSTSLTLELSDEDNTIVQSRIYANGVALDQTIPGGCVIRMMYFENIIMNNSTISGWICDAIMDNSQNSYEISVDLSSYNGGSSLLSNLPATTQGVSAFKIGDKIRIKSTLDFPALQLPAQVTVACNGYDVSSYLLGPGGVLISQPIGVLRWPTSADTEILNTLKFEYNSNYYPYPNQALLKYGGFIDVMVVGFTRPSSGIEYICVPLFNNGCGCIATNAVNATNADSATYATNATNASKVNISPSSSGSPYPLVFTNNVTAGNKSLYTDSVNSLQYNPSTNTLTVPNASITTAATTTTKATTIHVSTVRHPTEASTTDYSIQFNNPVKLYNYSNVSGTFNVKGSDHNLEGITLYGGSTTGVATLVVNGKSGGTTTRGNITCGKLTYTGGSLGTSDERLKDFKDDIEIDFNKLKEIPKKYFTWKYDEDKVINLGTSAQEVEKIYPEIVGEYVDESTNIEYKSIDYSKLSIVALAAIDKLNERIEYLENKLKEYEK